MRIVLSCTLAVILSCSETQKDTAEVSAQCPGNSIYVEVCTECGDAVGCDEMGYECRAICDADEDCQDGEVCMSSDEGPYCDERYGCD